MHNQCLPYRIPLKVSYCTLWLRRNLSVYKLQMLLLVNSNFVTTEGTPIPYFIDNNIMVSS